MPALLTTLGALNGDGGPAFERYAAVVEPLLIASGARLLGRGVTTRVVAGREAPAFIAVIEFPDEPAIHAFLESEAYRGAIKDRHAAFSQYTSFISEPV